MRFKNADDMINYLEILRKNPRSVFRLQERNPEDISPIPQKNTKWIPAAIAAGVAVAAIITVISAVSKGSCGDYEYDQVSEAYTTNEIL